MSPTVWPRARLCVFFQNSLGHLGECLDLDTTDLAEPPRCLNSLYNIWAEWCLNTSSVGELTLLLLKIVLACVLILSVLLTAGFWFCGARFQRPPADVPAQFSLKCLELDWWDLSHWHGQGYTLYLDLGERNQCFPFLSQNLWVLWCRKGTVVQRTLVFNCWDQYEPSCPFYLLPALSVQSPSPGAQALADLGGKVLPGISEGIIFIFSEILLV